MPSLKRRPQSFANQPLWQPQGNSNLRLRPGNKPMHDHPPRPGSGVSEPKRGLLIDARSLISALKPIIEEKCKDASKEELDIIFDNVEVALLEAQSDRRLRQSKSSSIKSQVVSVPLPKREFSAEEIEAIKAQGARHRWAAKEKGDQRSPVQWVLDHYGAWFDGLTTNLIGIADPKLYSPFMKEVARKGLPEGVDIPTSDENRERLKAHRVIDPQRPNTDQIGRDWYAARMRDYRARIAKQG